VHDGLEKIVAVLPTISRIKHVLNKYKCFQEERGGEVGRRDKVKPN